MSAVKDFCPCRSLWQRLRALTVGRQKPRLRGSRHTNPRYPKRPKDIHLENLEREAVGGLPFPRFDWPFVRHASAVSGTPPDEEGLAVWGCAGGCYFRTDTFLRLRAERPHLWNDAAAQAAYEAGACMEFMDVVGPARLRCWAVLAWVRPWAAVRQGGKGIAPAHAVIEHKCREQLRLRSKQEWRTITGCTF